VRVDSGQGHRGSRHSARAQRGASWDLYDCQMRREPGAIEEPEVSSAARRLTFLGSRTAPDEAQVRLRLREIRETSRRRKTYALCAVAAGTLLAVVLAQHAVPLPGRGAF
jgi:hypothetical protein